MSNNKKAIILVESESSFITSGFSRAGQKDLRVSFDDNSLSDEAYDCLKYFVDYIESYDENIVDQETSAYGSWLVKFVLVEDGLLNIEEYVPADEIFKPSIDVSLKVLLEQFRICAEHGSEFEPPLPHQKVVISNSVLNGLLPIEGIRYPSPDHMTGWWITTDDYDGNTDNLEQIVAIELLDKRPDLVKFFGLDFGYGFRAETEKEFSIVFDESNLE